MKKKDFNERVKGLNLNPTDKFKAEQTNELIEMIEHLRISMIR